jgi:hypothetical protein
MISSDLKKRLKAIEGRKNVKKELPWDCKNLMSLYKGERTRRDIINKLYDLKGENCEPPEPYRLEVEDQHGLSREAREFISLPAERQAKVVDYYYP